MNREQTRRDAERLRTYATSRTQNLYKAERETLLRVANALDALLGELEQAEEALRAICQTNDSGPWIEIYRAAGGGYEGLQAIASAALAARENDRVPTGSDH